MQHNRRYADLCSFCVRLSHYADIKSQLRRREMLAAAGWLAAAAFSAISNGKVQAPVPTGSDRGMIQVGTVGRVCRKIMVKRRAVSTHAELPCMATI
jgi:hypothetical protein